MSAFLAPIHYNVFNKIKNQNNINEDLLNTFGNEDLKKESISKFGNLPEGELEDIIDHGNIHGWLQENFIMTEKTLSFIVTSLLESGVELNSLREFFKEKGRSFKGLKGADEIFNTFTSFYMDGMPCDRAILPLGFREEMGSWKINEDVHGRYWADNGKTYKELRYAFLEGLSEENYFKVKVDGNLYEVKKCTV